MAAGTRLDNSIINGHARAHPSLFCVLLKSVGSRRVCFVTVHGRSHRAAYSEWAEYPICPQFLGLASMLSRVLWASASSLAMTSSISNDRATLVSRHYSTEENACPTAVHTVWQVVPKPGLMY